MPSAQGHLLVRRRPKDGDAGSDAVRYWVVPSTTQIKRAQDGTMYPSVVTCEKRKQTGNSQPIATNEGTLYYTIGYTDGSVTARTLYGSTGVKATSTMAWIKFMLDISQVEVASETVSVVADGEDAYVLDLDNEMQGIPCDSSGNPTGSGTLASTNSTVYKGSKADTGWTFAKTDTGCTSSIDDKGTVSVTAISADKASVKVTAMKGSVSLVAIMSLYKVKAGAPGTSPVVYSIETSVSAIGRNAAGTLNPKSFTAYKNKTEGATTVRTKEKILQYMRVGQDTSPITLDNKGGTIQGMTAACTAVQIGLLDTNGTTVLDVETIPIVNDGQKGNKGDDGVSYYIILTPDSVTIKADGTVVCDGKSVQAKAFKNVGGAISEASDGSMKLIVTKMEDGSTSEIATSGIMADGIGIYATVSFEYRINDVTVASAALVMNREGGQGIPGPTYQPLRVRNWDKLAVKTELYSGMEAGAQWTDIVYRENPLAEAGVQYWRCKQYFRKAVGQTLPQTEDANLVKVSSYGSLATDIFLANYALIKNLGAEAIVMRDSSGNLMFQAINGEVTCKTGNFENIHISRNSTFKGFVLKEKFEITSSNFNDITKEVYLGTIDGEDWTERQIDLLKTGNWIEIKSIPSNTTGINRTFYLPAIRVGEAYTDAYRDYVKQFLGNEIIIYNSTKLQFGVDSGESTRILDPGMAIHFKMVFKPEKLGNSDILLEKIAWEYSQAYQF